MYFVSKGDFEAFLESRQEWTIEEKNRAFGWAIKSFRRMAQIAIIERRLTENDLFGILGTSTRKAEFDTWRKTAMAIQDDEWSNPAAWE